MEYCGPKGIPHSVFLDWDEEDQGKALAHLLHKANQCPRCGQFPEDWIDEEGRLRIPTPKIAQTVACNACSVVQDRQKMIEKENQDSTFVILVENPDYDPEIESP